MNRWLAGCIILFSLVVFVAHPAQAGQGDIPIKITISPVAGETGTAVTVTGSGAEPNLTVRVVLSSQPAPSADVLEAVEFSANADGTFAVSLTIPPEVANGTYYIRAEQSRIAGGSPFYYYNTFQVGAPGDGALLPNTGHASNFSLSALWATPLGGVALLLITGLFATGIYAVRRSRIDSDGALQTE